MEVKESESSVIAKPVPSRPLYSGLRTFTELLVDSVNVSSPKSYHEALAAPIRPKTVRFRPTVKNIAPSGSVCSRGEVPVSGNSKRPSDERGTLESRSYVIYKPKPKLASKATISILANMQGRFCHQQPLRKKEAEVSNVSQDRWNFKNQCNPDLLMKVPSFGQTDAIISSDNPTGDRSSLDGYHWRKYGQKQVKGSEFPRGYFRCTYPNCPVKKKVERSLDGKISEIVYQGEHNHPRPCPLPRRSSSNVTQKLGFVSERSSGQDPVVYNCLRNQLSKQNDGPESERGDANRKGVGVFPPFEFAAFGATTNSAAGTSDSYCRSGECDETSKGLELDGEVDEPTTKRRKTGNQPSEAGAPEEGSAEPRNSVDSEALDDGFRWRKYGQKVVRGNPFPRSYYRCTSPNCGARKHVERASDDPRAFITTYEGKHNHH